jgi:transglutaminase-like putative cysteine protease
MSKFRIRHITKYLYEVPVRDSANQIMLYPVKDDFQEIISQEIIISGEPLIDVYQDYYGNEIGTFTHSQPHNLLVIDSRLQIITTPKELPNDQAPADEQWRALTGIKFQSPYIDFLQPERFPGFAEIERLISEQKNKNVTPLQLARHLCSYVFENFKYKKGITTVETTLDEIWQLKLGVCQDFAHMLLVILRMSSIPARYVSGYICPNKSGMRGEGATHAWVEAYIPFYGWLGLDPTNNCIANDTHVRLAVGKNFSDCSPVKGTYRGTSDHTLEVIVTVAYEDGNSAEEHTDVVEVEPTTSYSKNSFRRFQEMQQQQQQQQQQL